MNNAPLNPAPSKSRKRRKRFSFISPTGEIVWTSSIKAFAETAQMSHAVARQLACGDRTRIHGWCSTARKAKRQRERFLMGLIAPDGSRHILGRSVKHFA